MIFFFQRFGFEFDPMKTFNLPEWFPDSVLLPATKYILGDVRDKEPYILQHRSKTFGPRRWVNKRKVNVFSEYFIPDFRLKNENKVKYNVIHLEAEVR